MRKARQEWLDESGVHNPDNRARVVYFQRDPDNRNRAWFGFAEKWLKYKIGEHHLQALAKFEKEETPVLLAEIEACKSRIAALAHRPVSAVHISIEY